EASVDARSGSVSYRPAADYNGADTFGLEVSDGTAATPLEVPVGIAAVNDAPAAHAASHALDEDTQLDGQCKADDVDGDSLTFKAGQPPRHGALEINAATGAFHYAPAHDYHGPDSFTFQVSDGKLTSEAVVRLTVRPVNDAPVSSPLSLSGKEDETQYGALAASDADGDALAFTVSAPPAHGEARVDGAGAVTFVPAAD